MDDEVEIIGISQLDNGGRRLDYGMDDDFVNSSDEEREDPDPNSHEDPKSQTIGTSATETEAAAATTASSMNNHEYLQQTTTTIHNTFNLSAIKNEKEYQVVVKVSVRTHAEEAKMMIEQNLDCAKKAFEKAKANHPGDYNIFGVPYKDIHKFIFNIACKDNDPYVKKLTEDAKKDLSKELG